MQYNLTISFKVWNFGIVLDFESPFFAIGIGPATFRIGYNRPSPEVRFNGEKFTYHH